MKKTFILFFLFTCFTFLKAKEPAHSVSQKTYFRSQKQQQEVRTAQPSHPSYKEIATTLPFSSKQSEVMIIQPEMRAKDIQESFEYLKTMNPGEKLAVKLISGALITEIMDIKVMKGGTMIIFRINSSQGQKFHVVKTEQIDTLIHG